MNPPPRYEAFPQLDPGTHTGRIGQLLRAGAGTLVSAGETTIRVWDVAGRQLRRLLLGRVGGPTDDGALDGRVGRIGVSPDGRWLVALKPWLHPGAHGPDADCGHDAGLMTEVQVFEVATGNLQGRWMHPGQLLDLDFAPDGRRLALAANRREGRRRQVEVFLLDLRDVLRAGAHAPPPPAARHDVGRARRADTLPAALRFVPGGERRRAGATLVVAVGGLDTASGELAWLQVAPGGALALRRSIDAGAAIGVDTLAVGASMVTIGADPAHLRSARGRVLWQRHDGSAGGALDIEALPASAAFSPLGQRLAVGLMVDRDGGGDALSGTQTVQVNVYDVPPLGAPVLRSSYFGHDDTVRALAFVDEATVASAGGDNQAIHLWHAAHRIGELQGAIRGVGRVAYAPGISADERVLFGSVPQRLLPPGHAPRQQSFDLRRLALSTTAASRVRADLASRKWMVGDLDDVSIPLWFVGDGVPDDLADLGDPDLTLFVGADDEWVIWTRSGYYDAGSALAASRIGYRVNRGVGQEALPVPSDRFKAFYRPDIVRAVVRHGTEERARERGVEIVAVDVARILPPIVELARRGIRRHGDRVELAFSVESPCPEFAPTRLSLLRNGRVVWSEPKPAQRRFARCGVPPLPLLPGPNRFALHAENSQAKSVPVTFEIAGPERAADDGRTAAAPGTLFLLSVGVARFADARHKPLRFPHHDAQAVHDAVGHARLRAGRRRAGGNRAFTAVDARLLLDEQATKAAILAELDRMCDAVRERHRRSGRERDVLFVFLSGHGMRVYDHGVPSLFFVNHDLVPTAADVDATGLSILDLGDRITSVPAEVVLVIDACHASLAGSTVTAGLDAEETARRVHAIYERGMYLVSAAREDELAYEDGGSRNGVLTAALLEAIDDALPRARAGRGAEVLMADLVAGMQRLVPLVAARAGTAAQTPVCRVYGDLMPLTILKR